MNAMNATTKLPNAWLLEEPLDATQPRLAVPAPTPTERETPACAPTQESIIHQFRELAALASQIDLPFLVGIKPHPTEKMVILSHLPDYGPAPFELLAARLDMTIMDLDIPALDTLKTTETTEE